MNKQEMIDAIAEMADLPKTHVTRMIDAQAALVGDALTNGVDVTIFGIGKVKSVAKAARPGRNPQTGEPVTIEARNAVKFTASKALKDAIN